MICDIRLKQIGKYPKGIQSKHGKEFNSYRDILEYETNMQVALKEMGFYKGQIDANFGSQSKRALKKLKLFLELKPHQNINFRDDA